MECSDDGFIIVRRRKYRNKEKIKHDHKEKITKLNRDVVINNASEILSKFHLIQPIYTALLFGSVAKRSNKENSDIDIILIFKHSVPNYINEVKSAIEDKHNCSVDIVCMIYKDKNITDPCYKNEIFLDNIYEECIPFYGTDKDVFNIRLSRLIGKM